MSFFAFILVIIIIFHIGVQNLIDGIENCLEQIRKLFTKKD